VRTLQVEVSGGVVMVYDGTEQIYSFDDEGGSWLPGEYEAGRRAVLEIASQHSAHPVLSRAAATIRMLDGGTGS
jgi:hypothetical protein